MSPGPNKGNPKRRVLARALVWGAVLLALVVVWFSVPRGEKVSRTPADVVKDLRAGWQPWLSTLAHRTRIVRFLPNQWKRRLDAQEFAISRKREDAARELKRMGTNAWVVIPELVSTVRKRNVGPGYMAAQGLYGVRASEHPEWKRLSKPLRGSKEAAQLFHYMLSDIYSNRGTESEVAEYRRFALVALAATGPAATPFYDNVMQNAELSNDPRIRAAAVTALTGMESQRTNTVPLFKRMLINPEEWPEVSGSAAVALAEAAGEDPETRDLLKIALNDKRSAVRAAAVRALWRLKEPVENILPVLTQLMDHRLASVRTSALNVAAEMGGDAKSIRPQVERLLKDPDLGVQAAADRALKMSGRM